MNQEIVNLCQNQTFLDGFLTGMSNSYLPNPHPQGTEQYRLFQAGVEYATTPLGGL